MKSGSQGVMVGLWEDSDKEGGLKMVKMFRMR